MMLDGFEAFDAASKHAGDNARPRHACAGVVSVRTQNLSSSGLHLDDRTLPSKVSDMWPRHASVVANCLVLSSACAHTPYAST
jgi:hypothetical protein